MCCCPGRVCMLCTCLILVVIVVGFLFGFGVFKNGFHKLKHTFDVCDPASSSSCYKGRPFIVGCAGLTFELVVLYKSKY